jgi:hypothetical protein
MTGSSNIALIPGHYGIFHLRPHLRSPALTPARVNQCGEQQSIQFTDSTDNKHLQSFLIFHKDRISNMFVTLFFCFAALLLFMFFCSLVLLSEELLPEELLSFSPRTDSKECKHPYSSHQSLGYWGVPPFQLPRDFQNL